jgi:16S rRNA (uracil1498-N3)-methyltransferase
MNRILLEPNEITGDIAIVHGRRARHVIDVLDAQPGDELRVGVLGGARGSARLTCRETDSVTLELRLFEDPPAPFPVTLILALPRPRVVRRVLVDVAAVGIKCIHLIGARTVEKSYWDSPLLTDSAIHEHLILGLEQGGDTVLPTIECHRRFKPFVEDRLPDLVANKRRLVAHPGPVLDCPRAVDGEVALAVGPDRGFTDYEIGRLSQAGFEQVSLGSRTLRVESAVAMLLGRVI